MYRQRKSLQANRSLSLTEADGSQMNRIGEEVSQLLRPADSNAIDLSMTSPYDYFTDEVRNSFLKCSYKWSFYHIPTLLRRLRKKQVDNRILWAILALAIR